MVIATVIACVIMANEFQAGDVVQLKSGGPEMTVTEVGLDVFEKQTVWCVWFVGTKQEEGTFPPAALAKKR
jgi:uncharacterized protein YodC (DUF2158 family)